VSLSQQLFCSFDRAAFLIRALGSPVQVCEDWGSFLGQSILSPVGPWTYLRRAFQFACANM
jgi:hypothetical protein